MLKKIFIVCEFGYFQGDMLYWIINMDQSEIYFSFKGRDWYFECFV